MTFLVVLLAWGGDGVTIDARTIFEKAAGRDVRLAGGAVELAPGELFEDDGPAAGFSYLPNEEPLTPEVWVRKDLVIPNPEARAATLLVAPGGTLEAQINGTSLTLEGARKAGGYWQAYAVDPKLLKAGTNEIVLRGRGKVWIARAEDFAAGSRERARHPNRSARSPDGGKAWDFDRLGPEGKLDGEYYVRLYLDHYRPRGSLVLPVLDLGNLERLPVGPPVSSVGPVRLELEGSGALGLSVRTGPGCVPGAGWSSPLALGAAGTIESPAGRYAEISIDLSTPDPLATPHLTGLKVECSPRRPDDWTRKVRVLEHANAEIVRSSIPFAYEPFTAAPLRALREGQKLDDVVRGAEREFELITRLAAWSARRWERGHLREGYPAWDALEILKPHRDGTPVGGFCQQYNLVFLQACESFGLVGRAVSIGPGDTPVRGGGHEVVEIWSNDYAKWVYVDGNAAWYAADEKTGVPLSLWELRERQARALAKEAYPPVRVVKLAETRHEWKGLEAWPPFAELRLIPRSNFLEEKSPLPLNQGMRGWFWTGHYVWDEGAPPLYGNRVTRRGNFEWTLNQARLVLEAAERPGVVRVGVDTVTPGFESFVARVDGAAEKAVESGFEWALRPGANSLEVRARNGAGREGPPSRIVLQY